MLSFQRPNPSRKIRKPIKSIIIPSAPTIAAAPEPKMSSICSANPATSARIMTPARIHKAPEIIIRIDMIVIPIGLSFLLNLINLNCMSHNVSPIFNVIFLPSFLQKRIFKLIIPTMMVIQSFLSITRKIKQCLLHVYSIMKLIII